MSSTHTKFVGGKRKKKWSQGKQKEKANNEVLFNQDTSIMRCITAIG